MAGASMKSIKSRIRSMESTRQITKAMEMVASSKLRRAQERVAMSRPYFEVLREAFQEIYAGDTDLSSAYLRRSTGGEICYVVIAGDRGLAGGYNSNIFRMVQEQVKGKPVSILPIGKKTLEYFRMHGAQIISNAYAVAADLSISDCFTLARTLAEAFRSGKYDALHIAYTQFNSALSQTPAALQMLPLDLPARTPGPRPLTIYEPGSAAVFDAIVPEYLGGLIYGALCEAIASEQGARRAAMDSATKNADEMIDTLNLQYNRIRQGAITQEITEIVAGSES